MYAIQYNVIELQNIYKGIVLLQKIHFTKDNEIKRRDDFKVNLYFLRGKSKSSRILINFSGNKKM